MGTIERDLVEGRQRRVNPILIVVLVLLAIGAVAFFLLPLFFGGDEEVAQAPPPATRPSPAPPPAAAPPQAPAETFEVFESKDPFRPLVVAGSGGTTTGGTTGGVTAPAGAGAAGGAAPSGGQRVALLDVFDDAGTTKAQVKVGSTVYRVAPGETFAENFKLVSISGNCATFLHGDDRFTLCEGEEVIK